ncbi:dihydrolipoyllysine-residue succinyltransferase component of 2-oxoglutarate dehydrogenase complex 1, mitochondrial-like [Lolium rigidum]|uniref:dihydrolipoyllysine-residue succinyltransferase component of 2-oxoglutarate dehydrogenase complex 1, mitochondrial-like n=1 Tax=Lolium rigidum TaxID=89674 RepID=UPI001F5E2B82|nr:dihydrolipoyllysine-residue succinyltransferase component of 2-oxoglutarate dehydrogenase complex 1, mitochondrial-like [Lolium rigidum]
MASDGRVERIASTIRVIPDFPKPGELYLLINGRLSAWLHTGSTNGHTYYRRLSVRIWILDAAVWRRQRIKHLVGRSVFNGQLCVQDTLGLLRSHTHVRNYSSQLSGLIPAGPQSSKLTRRHYYFPNASPYQPWSRSFASDSGEKFEAVVPFMGESVSDGTLATFLKKPGDRVEADEAIAQIETDKVTIDVSSPEAGVLETYGTPN